MEEGFGSWGHLWVGSAHENWSYQHDKRCSCSYLGVHGVCGVDAEADCAAALLFIQYISTACGGITLQPTPDPTTRPSLPLPPSLPDPPDQTHPLLHSPTTKLMKKLRYVKKQKHTHTWPFWYAGQRTYWWVPGLVSERQTPSLTLPDYETDENTLIHKKRQHMHRDVLICRPTKVLVDSWLG